MNPYPIKLKDTKTNKELELESRENMKNEINKADLWFKSGIDDNQSEEELTEIIEQIKSVKWLTMIGDKLKTANDKYIIEITKIK